MRKVWTKYARIAILLEVKIPISFLSFLFFYFFLAQFRFHCIQFVLQGENFISLCCNSSQFRFEKLYPNRLSFFLKKDTTQNLLENIASSIHVNLLSVFQEEQGMFCQQQNSKGKECLQGWEARTCGPYPGLSPCPISRIALKKKTLLYACLFLTSSPKF